MSAIRRLASGGLAAAVVCAALWAEGAGGSARAAEGGDKSLKRAEKAIRAGDFVEAERMFREALAKDKQSVAARLGLSRALLKQRKHQDAFDHAARVLLVDPMSYRAHALLGESLLRGGDFRLSVEEFRTALEFKDDDAMAIAGLAMVAFYENRVQDALAGLRRAAFIDPNEPDYQFNLGQVAARAERYKEAADAYERFLRIAPTADADRRARIRGLIDFLRYLGRQGDLLNSAGATRAVVPIEMVNNRPILHVRINGSKETLRFVVDTGSGMCVVSMKTAERLGLKAVARGGMARAVGGPGRSEIVYGFLDSLHIGDTRVERVPIYLREFFNQQEPVDGYVGLSLLSKYLTSLDYGAMTITLLRGDARPVYDPAKPPPGAEIPIRITSSGFWSGEVKIDEVEKPANFIIDTGASTSVVSQAFAERETMTRFSRGERIKVYGAAGLTENVETLNIPRLRFGPHTHANVNAVVLDMEPINETAGYEQTGILGGNVLKNFRVTFDFARGVVRLEPLANPAQKDSRGAQTPVISNQP